MLVEFKNWSNDACDMKYTKCSWYISALDVITLVSIQIQTCASAHIY